MARGKSKVAASETGKIKRPRKPHTYIVILPDDFIVCKGKDDLAIEIGKLHNQADFTVYDAKEVIVRYETKVVFGAPRAEKTQEGGTIEETKT